MNFLSNGLNWQLLVVQKLNILGLLYDLRNGWYTLHAIQPVG